MNALTKFAAWASAVSYEHTPIAYDRARRAVLDTVACMAAGVDDESAVKVRQTAKPWGTGTSTIVGTDQHSPAPWAALANATSAHALDFDDYEAPANSHASAVLVPALLALGEARAASGSALLDAYIIGLEIIIRTGEAVNLAHYHRGWHTTATVAPLGAAAACGRLLNLDATEMANALSLATSMAAGFNTQFGTMAKPVHAGLGAKSGLLAASLAATGITASSETLDGPWSFLSLLAGDKANGFREPLTKLGQPLAIEEHGLLTKLYPSCGYIHHAVDGVLALRAEHNIDPDEVVGATVTIPGRNTEILQFSVPRTPMQARFSMHYSIAVALCFGKVEISDFKEPALERTEVRTLLPRVRLEGHPTTPASTDLNSLEPDVVELHLNDGKTLTKSVEYPRGSPQNPISNEALINKFDACTQGVFSTEAAAAAKSRLVELDALPDIRELTRYLTVPSTTSR